MSDKSQRDQMENGFTEFIYSTIPALPGPFLDQPRTKWCLEYQQVRTFL